jgi:hypothetical protein
MTDHTEPLIEQLLQAAYDHGVEEGSDVAAGDFQEILRAARALLSTEQRAAFFEQPEIRALKRIPGFEHFRQDRGVAGGPQ